MSDVVVLETALSERDVAALHAWQAQQSKRVAEAEAERDHLRRALEWAAVRDRVGVRTALAATEAQA
jgi:hypothetical protein